MEEDIWQKYCSFLNMDFESQVCWNEKYLYEYFKDWVNTKMAKQLCPCGVKGIEGVPITTYLNYPVLHEFTAKMQELRQRIPRKKGEDFCDYNDKLGRQCVNIFDGWMADRYAMCVMTSGTTGESKWIVHGETFWKNMLNSLMAMITLSCSNKPGKTSLKKGDALFAFGSSAPYIGGYMLKAFIEGGLKIIPPLKVVNEERDFMKKFRIALQYAKKMDNIDILASSGSLIKLTTLYFTNQAELFRNNYETTKIGIKKIILWLLWKYKEVFGKKLNTLKEVIHPKGVFLGSFDSELYYDYARKQLDSDPINLYGATEIGFPAYGRLEWERYLVPDLRTGYFEFLDMNKNIRKIDELEYGKTYELVFTPFRSILLRYKMGDIFRVINFKKDGCPIFSFESRTFKMLDIYNYFRLSMSMAFKAFSLAGFPPSNNWAFTKEFEPREHLVLLMEKEQDLTEKEVAAKLYNALKEINQEFKTYIEDFKINNPEYIIKVIYLKRGAFKRYTEIKVKQGVPLGRIKPARIITPQHQNIIKILRSA